MTVVAEKYLFIMIICVLSTTSRFLKHSQTIFLTLKELFLSKSVHTMQVLHPVILNFHFLWKTYSLVSHDFCNLSATRLFIGTNGENAKNIKTAESLIDHFHC